MADTPAAVTGAPARTIRPGSRGDPRRAVLIALMITLSLAALDSTVVTTAVPSVVHDLGGFNLFPWLFSIYLLTQAVTVPIYGRMADLFGRKPILFVGIGIFIVGSVLCGAAWNMVSLIVFRGIQGLGAGAILPIVQTVVGDQYTVAERARVSAYTSSVWGVSSVLGPLIGGLFSQYISWRWIFYVNVPIAAVAVVMLQRRLREEIHKRSHEIDYLGTVVLTAGLALLIFALLEGGTEWAWTSPVEIGMLVGAAVLLFAFGRIERRVAEPMVPLWVISRRSLVSANIGSLAVGACLLGFSTYIPTWAQGVRHVDPIIAGLTVASITLGWPLSAANAGRVYLRIGFKITAIIGAAVSLVGIALCTTLDGHSSILTAAGYGFITGLGLGFVSTPTLVYSQSLVGWERRGVVTASNLFARTIGSALGIAVFGAVANSSLAHSLAIAPPRIATQLGSSVNVAAKVLGGGKITLSKAATAYVRSGLSTATHAVFIAVFGVLVLGVAGLCAIPRRLEPIDFGDGSAPDAETPDGIVPEGAVTG
jgi:EmrB/QacA subfamily drug resistance transporter